MNNIKYTNNKYFKLKLNYDNYFDFQLSNKHIDLVCSTDSNREIEESLITYFDFNDINSYITDKESVDKIEFITPIRSLVSWKEFILEAINQPYFGLTGYDNGIITEKPERYKTNIDSINRNTFLFTNSNLVINNKKEKTSTRSNDLIINGSKLHLFPVTSTSDNFDYDMKIEKDDRLSMFGTDKYTCKFRGGFFQGFYKLDNLKYEVLPNRYEEGFTISLWLKHEPFALLEEGIENKNPLNNKYKDIEDLSESNDGFFLYFGTRAENKFWREQVACKDDDGVDDIMFQTLYSEKEYLVSFSDGSTGLFDVNTKPKTREITNQFLIMGRATKSKDYDKIGSFTSSDFEGKEIKINAPLLKFNEYKENPFLLFGRSSGERCCSSIKGKKQITVDEITDDVLLNPDDNNEKPINFYEDVVDNALGFRITKDGRVGFRYITYDEDGDVVVVEDYTKPYVVNEDFWSLLNIKWIPNKYINNSDKCKDEGRRDGKLLIYVNCLLIHEFDFPEFIAKRLNTSYEKQLGVSYNISLGGGSQGLSNHFTLNGLDCSDLDLLIERYFSGTFIGSISEFKIYNTNLNWCQLKSICIDNYNKYGDVNALRFLIMEYSDSNHSYILQENYGRIII